ncbi:MAG: hypothetical protein AB9869_12270 [Verrucomicrobiia bacterium]
MSDFRRWRDGLLIGDGGPHALNGSPAHVKKDGNGDGPVNPVDDPVGQTYFLRSEPVPLRDGTNVIMVSPATKFIPPNDRGADYAEATSISSNTFHSTNPPTPIRTGSMMSTSYSVRTCSIPSLQAFVVFDFDNDREPDIVALSAVTERKSIWPLMKAAGIPPDFSITQLA